MNFKPSPCVVLIEDDKTQREILKLYLKNDGYEVVEVSDGAKAIETIRKNQPILILLDLMLPSISGREIFRVIRLENSVPIIIVTASGAEDEIADLIDAGADDYIIKPYRPRELMSRVRAAIRRNEIGSELRTKITYLDLEIDLDGRTITKGSERIDLTLSEFEIVVTLCANPGKVFTRMQLIDRITAYGGVGLERTVDTHISNIRKKLKDDLTSPQYITTVIGIGYKAL